MTDLLPPHLAAGDGPDPEAEAVVAAIAAIWGVPRWQITSEREAEWVMSKFVAAFAEIERCEADAAEYRARIDAWLEDRTRRARATSAWAEAHLERWGRAEHDADPKVLSRKLPSGKVASRAGSLEWVVVDEPAVLRVFTDEGLDDLVVSKVAGVQKLAAALTADEQQEQAVTPDGTVVTGLVVRRRPRTWKVTPT